LRYNNLNEPLLQGTKMLRPLFLCFSFVVLLQAQSLSPVPKINHLHDVNVIQAFDIPTLKSHWHERVQAIRAHGEVPLIDAESSFDAQHFKPKTYALLMDKLDIALIAFSSQVSFKKFEENSETWDDSLHRLIELDPYRYVPTTTAGIYPVWTQQPLDFAKESTSRAVQEAYPLLGEFDFHRSVSLEELKHHKTVKEISIPIDSLAAQELFQFSERTHIPFEIHYDVEDALLPPLEKMLETYSHSKVIWCHLGQVRDSTKAKHYTPLYVQGLIEHYPNLYFDLAVGDWHASDSTIWDHDAKQIKPAWKKLIEEHPYRFLMALGMGENSPETLEEKVRVAREILKNFSPDIQEIIAYKAFWRLVFHEDFK